MFIQLFDQYTFFFQRNRAFFLCCGYKEGIPQSSTKTSSRQSIVLFSLSLLWLSLFSCLTVVMPQASTFLVRSENISDAVWREITNEIRRDADYLFKIIGKAYAMLLDPTTVCITEISFIFFLCSCYWCCIFFYFLLTRTFMSNEWALFWIRFILPDVVNYNRPSIAIISQM